MVTYFVIPGKSISSMVSCAKTEFLRTDLVLESFASEGVSVSDRMYPSSVI